MEHINSEVVYDGYSTVIKKTFQRGNQQFSRELLTRGSSVTLLIFDSVNELFLLTHEFRVGEFKYRKESCGLVAGMIEEGFDHIETSAKELEEETGLTVPLNKVGFLGKCFTSPGITDEESYLCFADVDLTKADTSKTYGVENEHEEIRISVHSKNELEQIIANNDFSASSFALLTAYKLGGLT